MSSNDTIPFGEIARQISKRVEPSTTDAEIYIGLEHLDPNSQRIKRWGTPADVKGQKLEVRKGQIIFGKRRAYQRKLGVAHFDGICSAHAMVLEANPETIIPQLLPFFMQSDRFMERAVAVSEGSLSPTIKWKTLAAQKFPLPPKKRQREILKLLQALEDSLRATEDAIESAEQLKRSLMARLLTKGIGHSKFKQTEIGEIPVEWEVGHMGDIFENLDHMRDPIKEEDRKKIQGDIPYYGASGMIDQVNRYIFDEELLMLAEDGMNLVFRAKPIAYRLTGKAYVNNHVHVYRPTGTLSVNIALEVINMMDLLPFITGSYHKKINKAAANSIPLPIPPEAEQVRILENLNNADEQKKSLVAHRDSCLSMKSNCLSVII